MPLYCEAANTSVTPPSFLPRCRILPLQLRLSIDTPTLLPQHPQWLHSSPSRATQLSSLAAPEASGRLWCLVSPRPAQTLSSSRYDTIDVSRCHTMGVRSKEYLSYRGRHFGSGCSFSPAPALVTYLVIVEYGDSPKASVDNLAKTLWLHAQTLSTEANNSPARHQKHRDERRRREARPQSMDLHGRPHRPGPGRRPDPQGPGR